MGEHIKGKLSSLECWDEPPKEEMFKTLKMS